MRWYRQVGRDFVRVQNWTVGDVRQLAGRTELERQVAELELQMRIGRSRPQYAGPRTPAVMREIVQACGDPNFGDDYE